MAYNLILVDPPWQYRDKSLNRGGAERHYPTMTLEEMRRLNVKGLAEKECALCMWVTMPHLETGLQLIREWGFVPVTCLFVWVKTYSNGDPSNPFVGMGHHTRSNAELMLLAKPKGGKTPKRQDASIRQVQYFPVTSHSAKPPEFRDLVKRLYGDLPGVELFAREKAPGWDAWGNEVESDVKLGASPFKSIAEAWHFANNQRRVGFVDFRIICPACFDIGELEGHECGDGGAFAFNCDRCGYSKLETDVLNFDTALKTIARGGR